MLLDGCIDDVIGHDILIAFETLKLAKLVLELMSFGITRILTRVGSFTQGSSLMNMWDIKLH